MKTNFQITDPKRINRISNERFNRELFNCGIEEAALFVDQLNKKELYSSTQLTRIAKEIRDLKK